MRVLSVTESYAPFLEFGGPPVKVRALAKGLASRGHSVTVLTADWGVAKRCNSTEGFAPQADPFGWRWTECGVTAIYLRTRLKYRSLTWNPVLKRFCRTELAKCDIVHIFGLYDFLGPSVAASCVQRKIPFVLEPIGMFVPIVRSLRLKKLYHSIFGRRLFERAAAIVATSEQEVEELAGGGIAREKITLRRNGVEVPGVWLERGTLRKRLGIGKNAKVILFLGRFSEKKSPDLLLRAFAQAAKQMPDSNLQLIFAGPDEGGMQNRLRLMAEQLAVAAHVHFAGALFGEAKWAAYRDANVFVLPSQNENFGNTAAESVAAGTPVIVTENCGIAPLLENVAGLVVPHEESALAKAICTLASDAALHAKLAAGCAEATGRMGWEEPVRYTEELYNAIAIR